jgi:hypothetical protein
MPSLVRASGHWSDVIGQVAEEYFNGVIDIFTVSESVEPFNPETGEGGNEVETFIATGVPARIQHLREPRPVTATYEATTYRRVRFQVNLATYGSLAIPEGARIRIADGGKDPELVGRIAVVTSAVNSSHAAVRTIEGITNG